MLLFFRSIGVDSGKLFCIQRRAAGVLLMQRGRPGDKNRPFCMPGSGEFERHLTLNRKMGVLPQVRRL